MGSETPEDDTRPPVPVRKRRRPAVVCTECRRRKVGCNRQKPCAQCLQFNAVCIYDNDTTGAPVSSSTTTGGHVPVSTHKRLKELDASRRAVSDGFTISSLTPRPTYPLPAGILSQTGGNVTTSTSADIFTHAWKTRAEEETTVCDSGISEVNQTPVSTASNGLPSALPQAQGRFEKSRFFGRSHLMNAILPFESYLRAHLPGLFDKDKTSEVYPLLDQCKQLARIIKADRPTPQSLPLDLREYVPPRAQCDSLIRAYFRTFETVYRVLHVPTFELEYSQYWADPAAAPEAFVVKLLLVLAIGTCFHQDSGVSRDFYHRESWQWIYAAQLWLGVPCEKRRLGLVGVQVHCLILFALQINAVGADLSWISAGALLRAAMGIGLHRDPIHFTSMSVLESEVRRRLWATVLEITLQASLDFGMPPLLSMDDFDTEPPANLNDDDLSEASEYLPSSKPISVYTQTSTQCALMRSVSCRLRVAQALNALRSRLSYEDALHLGTELTNTCRSNSVLFQSFLADKSSPNPKPSMFQIKLLDLHTRRFLVELHAPFALQAGDNLAYYFSRKVCLESCLLLLSYSTESPLDRQQVRDDYSCLQLYSRGLFKFVLLRAAFPVILELVTELRENVFPFTSSPSQNGLYDAVRNITELAAERIKTGETSVIAYVCLASSLGHIDALRSGPLLEHNFFESARTVLEESYDVLQAHAAKRGLSIPTDDLLLADCNMSDRSALDDLLLGGPWGDDGGVHFDLNTPGSGWAEWD